MGIDLSGVLDALPAMVWTALPDGSIDFVNRRWCEYTGLRLDEAHGWAWQAAVEPDDLPGLLERWKSILTSGQSGDMEARVLRFDGQYRWFLVQCSPIPDEAGRIVKWCGVATDVEDLRRAEEASQQHEQDFRLIVDGIPGFVAVLAPDGAVEMVNPQIVEYCGQPLEGLRNWGTNGTVHPDDMLHVAEIFMRSIAAGVPYEIEQRLRRFDGAYRWFSNRGVPVRDRSGRLTGWYVLLIDIDERRRAEEALRLSEARLADARRDLQLTIDTIPVFVAIYEPDGTRSFVNRTWQDYMGLTLEEATGAGARAFPHFHPDDAERNDRAWRASLESGEALAIEVRVLRADGQYRWHKSLRAPLHNERGEVIRWYSVGIDIEDQKRAEEAFSASERNLKLIIDTIPAVAWSAGPGGHIEFFNQHYLDYVGLAADQAEYWDFDFAVHPDDRERLNTTLRAIMSSGQPGEAEVRLRRFDGQYRWFLCRANPLRDESGTIVKWYGTNTDIDERKRAEEELRRSEAFLADAQRLSRTGSFSWRVSRDELTWSDETYRIYGFDPAVPVTFDMIRKRVHPENLPTLHEVMELARSGGGEFDYETRLLMPDQSIKHLHVVARSTRGPNGELELSGAVQDVTERRLADEALGKLRSELAHMARVTSLGALTASIAHEVSQPLLGIITNASTCMRMLAADPPNVTGARETARRTIRDGNRASDVITRLRALFAKKPGALELVDLNEAAQEVIALSASDLQRNRVMLRMEFDHDLAPIVGDRVQLQQVILNLLRNASDAMSSIDDRPRQLVVATEREEGDSVRLSVRDAGVGLDPQAKDRLFEAFYTTKDTGMGIGLSISRSIIESHNGRLWAAPNDGPGATFAFSIPAGADHVTDALRPGAVLLPTEVVLDPRQ